MPTNLAARLAEIDRRYAWHARQQREHKAPLTITTLRTSELERFYRDSFGGRFPASSEGIKALTILAAHHLRRNTPEMVAGWLGSIAPWLRQYAGYASDVLTKARALPQRYTAAALGELIGLTIETRRRLRIRTIRAVGQTDASMVQDRRGRDRERKAMERRAAGCRTREEWLANCLTQTRPWERFGISRRTWERRGKPMPQSPVASPSAINKDKIFTLERPATDTKGIAPSALYRAQARSETREFTGIGSIGIGLLPTDCREAS